jgi:hypothetical protein
MAVRFETPTQSGINIFPVTCLLLPGSIIVSYLTSRLGRFRWAIWIGWVITAVGCGLLVLLDEDTPTALWAAILAIFGVGNGMVLTSVNVGIQAISRVEDCGRAASMYAFMRTLGMTIGVAVGGTVFQNVMSAKLEELHLPEAIAHNAEAFAVQLAQMSPSDPLRVGALTAYMQGYRGVFWIMTATAVFGLLASLVIRKHSMDKILESKFTLHGGSGAVLRGKVETVEQNIARMSHRFSSHIDLAASRMGSKLDLATERASSMFLRPDMVPPHRRTMGAEDMIPLRPASARSAPQYRTAPIPASVRPRSTVSIPVEQAPAVAYYITPTGKRIPLGIPTSKMNSRPPIPPVPDMPKATFYMPKTSMRVDSESMIKESNLKW